MPEDPHHSRPWEEYEGEPFTRQGQRCTHGVLLIDHCRPCQEAADAATACWIRAHVLYFVPITADSPQAAFAEAVATYLAWYGCPDLGCMPAAIGLLAAVQRCLETGSVVGGTQALQATQAAITAHMHHYRATHET